ncbi:MAG: hypothetical protein A2958_01475 [Candidatus Levybacteria bacterium RIFCSPLOWO2_01_FULL_38_13]|nr:MAG: hypothetical protein A2629_01595 [Candidatus Levybacteria bacterium RIFCSPHIGHO2_01_FULL_41_15]OGH34619.1 MAG: hypothetical protein A2958_01475 [Candidatus Levybacteria bacterium RIFCSPLOWO2_01_FULL_38_13]
MIINSFYILLIVLVFLIGIYNFLFLIFSQKTEKELIIILPEMAKKTLMVNVGISIFAFFIILYVLLQRII